MTAAPGSSLTHALDQARLCPVCCSEKTSSLREVFDDRYGHPDPFRLVRCDDCGHLMTMPRPIEDELSTLYGTYYPRRNLSIDDVVLEAARVKLKFARIRRWWSGVDNQGQYAARAGEKMLDVGCGSGLTLLEARNLGIEAWGIEADPNVKRFADTLDLRIHHGSLHDQPFVGIDFDLIVLNQVIEHIPEPDKALEMIRGRLAQGGRVIMVFPNTNSLWCKLSGARWINWHIPYHIHHFTAASFSQMAKRCGFQVVRSRTITPNAWTILQLRANRQQPVRGQPNPMWEVAPVDSHAQVGANRPVSLRRFLKPPVMMAVSIVNRIVDAFGFGDSLMIELKPRDIR